MDSLLIQKRSKLLKPPVGNNAVIISHGLYVCALLETQQAVTIVNSGDVC